MKYDSKFPDLPLEEERDGVWKTDRLYKCDFCRSLTLWRLADYNVPCCSEECAQEIKNADVPSVP